MLHRYGWQFSTLFVLVCSVMLLHTHYRGYSLYDYSCYVYGHGCSYDHGHGMVCHSLAWYSIVPYGRPTVATNTAVSLEYYSTHS